MKYMGNPTFDKVRDLSTKFYLELPQGLKDELYEALNRGIDILDSEPQMTAYIFAYGKMHQAKLNYAFDKLSDNFFGHDEINIIDYGCGQAIGTMCYADFLHKNGYSQKAKSITLIEPSEICLKRAALHVSAFFPDAEIKTVNKGFNDLNENDIICSEEIPTLHILSNVLDIFSFDICNFAELIKNNLKGKNQFICVAPYYNGKEKDNRMDLFASKINGSNIITRKYKANEFIPEKEWTCKISCFQKNIGSSEKIKDSDFEQHTIYYVADEKLDKKWVDENSISHEFLNGKGKIILKDSVIEIGESAFSSCCGLTSINIPDPVTGIGDRAFHDCNGLTSIYIPDSVTRIGIYAFYGCRGLTSINIPNSVTEIGVYAFDGCCELSSINIPDSVTKIGFGAFIDCSGITSINIPYSVTEIDGLVFMGCTGLISIVVDSANGKYDSRDNCNAIIETETNKLVAGCKNTIISASVTEIGYGAFEGCSGLNSINIPESVIEIGDEAFCGCRDLTSIVVAKDNRFYNSRNNCNAIIETATNKLVAGCMNTIIPNSVTEIGRSAFRDCRGLTSINIPDSVTEIGAEAFSGCSGLTSINISDSVTEIGYGVFEDCRGLTSINIPNSVTTIGECAFYGCSGLTSINIPDKVKYIGNWAFADCLNLNTIYIPDSVTVIDENAFEGCESLKEIIIHEGTRDKFEKLLPKYKDKLVER